MNLIVTLNVYIIFDFVWNSIVKIMIQNLPFWCLFRNNSIILWHRPWEVENFLLVWRNRWIDPWFTICLRVLLLELLEPFSLSDCKKAPLLLGHWGNWMREEATVDIVPWLHPRGFSIRGEHSLFLVTGMNSGPLSLLSHYPVYVLKSPLNLDLLFQLVIFLMLSPLHYIVPKSKLGHLLSVYHHRSVLQKLVSCKYSCLRGCVSNLFLTLNWAVFYLKKFSLNFVLVKV